MVATRDRVTSRSSPTAPALTGPWQRVRAVAVVAVLLLGCGYAEMSLSRPEAAPGDAAPATFSATRAMDQVRMIGRVPHPAGSAAMHRVADHLQTRLMRLGWQVRPLAMTDPVTGVRLHVVAGRLSGTDSTGAVLVVAHPDSVPEGPGAGDNATGAAVLLESARALSAGPRLRDDVLVVFDDGEELGDYRGGELFAAHHPWAGDVRLVVGLDTAAWGVPVLMQDSANNGVLVDGYAAGAKHPVALGLDASTNREDSAEIGAFRSRGVPGIEIEDTYADIVQHTAHDTISHVAPRSLQQMGDQVLGTVRAYAALDLRHNTAPDQAFFTLPWLGVMHYDARLGWVPVAVSVLALLGVVVALARRGAIGLRRMVAGVSAAVGLVVMAMVLAKAASAVYATVWPDSRVTSHPLDEYLLPSSIPYAAMVAALVGVAVVAAYLSAARRLGVVELALGFVIGWTGLAVLSTALVPVGGYLFQWPAAAATLTWSLIVLARRGDVLLVVPALVAVVVLTPQLLLAFQAGGVAVLPDLMIATATVGLIIPAVVGLPQTRPSRRSGWVGGDALESGVART